MYEDMKRVVAIRKDLKDQSHNQYLESSSGRLSRSIRKKFETTFIGALSYFEDAFGYLWAHRIPEDELTKDELLNRRKWEQVRTLVLNNGNNQLRAAQLEIDQYTVEWNRHKITQNFNKNSRGV